VGQIRSNSTEALLFFALFSRSPEVLDLAENTLVSHFGPITIRSPRFLFTDTRYYERTMGTDVWKEWIGVDRLIDQASLADIKIQTNRLEEEIAAQMPLDVARPINIDPGMVDEGKVMLASTKNHAHRIYLGQGIFAEVTLYLREGNWDSWPWTYPDYRRPEAHAFCDAIRARFRELKQSNTPNH
jgi:hypothetical protein